MPPKSLPKPSGKAPEKSVENKMIAKARAAKDERGGRPWLHTENPEIWAGDILEDD